MSRFYVSMGSIHIRMRANSIPFGGKKPLSKYLGKLFNTQIEME